MCAFSQSLGWRLDGWTDLFGCGRWRGVWVSALFSSLCSLKGGDGEAEAQTQASRSALKGDRAWGTKDTWTGREHKGLIGLWEAGRAMYCLSVLLNSQLRQYGDSPGGGDREHCISTFT